MIYRTNFLTKVLVRFDFDHQPAIQSYVSQPDFSRAIAELFPICQPQPIATMSVVFGLPNQNVQPQTTGFQWLHLRDANATSNVTLNPAFLSYEIGKDQYQHFNLFTTDVARLLDALENTTPVRNINRIGLRYINEIALPDGRGDDWDGILNPSLISFVDKGLWGDDPILRSMHQIVTGRDGRQTLVNHGLLNPDYPGPNVQRYYVLDIDVQDGNQQTTLAARTSLNQLNEIATSTFEAAIEDGLRTRMGIIEHD